MSVTAPHLVGREEELGAIVELLDDTEQLPAVVVLAGEAGIGKTTLWAAGIEAAAERGYRVLSCRPSEAETRYSFAGLTDLLGDEADEIIAELPPIQQRALGAALLRGDSYDEADERVIAAAFLGALRLLASDRPLCVAVRRRPVAGRRVACRAPLRACPPGRTGRRPDRRSRRRAGLAAPRRARGAAATGSRSAV